MFSSNRGHVFPKSKYIWTEALSTIFCKAWFSASSTKNRWTRNAPKVSIITIWESFLALKSGLFQCEKSTRLWSEFKLVRDVYYACPGHILSYLRKQCSLGWRNDWLALFDSQPADNYLWIITDKQEQETNVHVMYIVKEPLLITNSKSRFRGCFRMCRRSPTLYTCRKAWKIFVRLTYIKISSKEAAFMENLNLSKWTADGYPNRCDDDNLP